MSKLGLLMVLLTIGVGFATCSQRQNRNADLEQYLDEENNNQDIEEEEEDEGEPDDSEAEDEASNEVETQIEAPSMRTDLSLLTQQNAIKDFDALMNNEAMRSSLQHISDKLRELFYEIKTREAIQNIMKNLNMMQTIPQVNELIEKSMESWSMVIEDKDSKEIIGQMKELHQILSEDPGMGETIAVIKEAVHAVHKNNASRRIILGGIKTLHRLAEQKQAVHGILTDTMRILGDHEKLKFALTTGIKIAPFFGTLQSLLSSHLPSQIEPEPLSQQKPLVRSLSVKPSAPVRKISIRKRFDN
ncbi:hypothetical protein WDU94_013617 [Cyamophila willieti]